MTWNRPFLSRFRRAATQPSSKAPTAASATDSSKSISLPVKSGVSSKDFVDAYPRRAFLLTGENKPARRQCQLSPAYRGPGRCIDLAGLSLREPPRNRGSVAIRCFPTPLVGPISSHHSPARVFHSDLGVAGLCREARW